MQQLEHDGHIISTKLSEPQIVVHQAISDTSESMDSFQINKVNICCITFRFFLKLLRALV